ncbi:hybrid sensor histidine kinase/response regulator transcription factor [Salisaeta longa]|uniref:hybrid sensor histidine kinase/response regulator transcription factor n=1 Tax=Salisaeta longa TaxID=503170 RepID=UPI00146A3861|nr:two-component regulator propeller domain-containing protein [Salisaeta longa]
MPVPFSGPSALPDTGAAPTFVRTQWTVKDGLPVNAINDLARTNDGYLWMATFDGLVRFDGARFRVYRSGTTPGLPSSRITRVQPHPDGLWLVTESRQLVRLHNGRFETINTGPRVVTAFHVGPSRTVWVGTNNGLYRWTDANRLRRVDVPVPGGRVLSLLERPDGTLWVGTNDGLLRRGPNGSVRTWTTANGLAGEAVYDLAAHPDSASLWIGTFPHVQRWAAGTLTTLARDKPDGAVHDLFVDATGVTWLTTPNRLLRYTAGRFVPDSGRSVAFTTFRKNRRLRFNHAGTVWTNTGRTLERNGHVIYRASSTIEAVQRGPHSVLWLGTSGNGLVQLHPSRVRVWGTSEGLSSSIIYPIEQHRDGSIWMGTLGGGAVRLDPDADTTRTYFFRKGAEILRNVWALHQGRSGAFWVGGTDLCRVEDAQCAHPNAPNPFRPTRIRAIYEDRDGRLWVGTENGLYRREQATDASAPWTRFMPQNSGLPHPYVRVIRETPDGALWVGTNGGGIARYHNGRFVAFTQADGLPSNLIRDIYRDPTGTFWLATEDEGLVRIQWAAQDDTSLVAASLAHITTAEGLFDNVLHRILTDSQERFWMSSNRGLFWVRRAALNAVANGSRSQVRSIPYTTRHGLRNREANGGVQPAGIRAQDGRLWFPTQEGAVVVDPATDPVRESAPPVVVEALVPEGGAPRFVDAGRLPLPPDQRNFSIRYAALHFRDPEHLTFRYRLRGLHQRWIEVDRREAFFTNLDPGSYTFEVSVRSARSGWSPPATQVIVLKPTVYETTWFRVVLGLLVLGIAGAIVYGGVQYRLRRLRQREDELSRQVREKTKALRLEKQSTEEALEVVEEQARVLADLNERKSRFFTSISHELRTPLALIKGPVQHVLRGDEELSASLRRSLHIVEANSERLEALTVQVLNLAKYDAGRLSLTVRRYPLADFVERVAERFAHRAHEAQIDLLVDVEAARAAVELDAEHMETVLGNLLENALKYTPRGGRVRVTASVQDHNARIAVHDTGPGLSVSEQEHVFERFYRSARTTKSGTGIGLALAYALTSLHNGTLRVESPGTHGSTFIVIWPVEIDRSPARPNNPSAKRCSGDGTSGSALSPHVPDSHEAFAGDGSAERAQQPSARAAPAAYSSGTATAQPTVLVVDDDPDMRTFVRSILEPDYLVRAASDGHAALRMSREILPDCVVADVVMPRVDGMELVAALRKHDATEDIPVVMLTARADTDDQITGLTSGADAYLTKPFVPDVLRAHVHQHITTRHRLREQLQTEPSGPASLVSAAMYDAIGADASSAATDEVMQSLQTYLEAHLVDPEVGVADMAEAVSMTPRTLRRHLKKTVDQTPNQFLRAVRIQVATRLLADNKGTVAEVAYAVGFNSHSYFSRCFKKQMGCSPSDYADRSSSV